MNRYEYHNRFKYKENNKVYPAGEAKTMLADQIKEWFTSDAPFKGNGVMRWEIPIESQDLLKWLAGQQSETKFYFSGRDAGDIEAAGIGIADSIGFYENSHKGHEGPRRKNRYEIDGRGLIHQTQQVNRMRQGLINQAPTFMHMRRYLTEEYPYLRYYGGFAFAPDHIDADWVSFGAVHFFIPRFELRLEDGQTYLACNVVLNNEKPGDADKIPAELEHLRFDDYPEFSLPGKLLSRKDYPDYREWEKNLNRVMAEIRAGQYEKTVLARKVVLDFDSPLDAAAILFFLKEHVLSRRYDFLFQFEGKRAFVGSSPERLYKRNGRSIESEALAGTRSRGKEEQDDSELALELMNSDKEQREHNVVKDFIEKGLGPLCDSLEVEDRKGLLKLKEGQHLITHLRGILKEDVTDEVLIESLHPTPAVGGCPRDRALAAISRCEPFKRGWYAGVIGTVGYDSGDFAVGLRSGLMENDRLCLYSGVGIVEGSMPEAEWQEVECKITNFLEIINGKR
jgi:menaquinone-specific isochorismate synthase